MGLFGTDGVRGVAGRGALAPERVRRLGLETARLIRARLDGARPVAVVGRDTRVSGPAIERLLSEGLGAGGLRVFSTGILPTPAIAFLTREVSAALGVIISASHNPPEDNGIKFVGPDAMKIPDRFEAEIERRMIDPPSRPREDAPVKAAASLNVDPLEKYVRWLTRGRAPLDGMRIVVDCGFGAAVRSAPAVMDRLGGRIRWLHDRPDGARINRKCGATHPEAVAKTVRKFGADVGISFDGDQDRVILCDERGDIVDGDHVLAMCALDLQKTNRIRSGVIVGTVMSNWGLERFCRDRGLRLVRAPVGDRFVGEAMRREGAVLGGEPSGHVIFMDSLPTGDGMLTALQVLGLMKKSGRRLSEMASVVAKCPQSLKAVRVARKPPLERFPKILRSIRDAERRLGDNGRVVVRYSGTENVCRVMVEGFDGALVERLAQDVSRVVRESLP